MRTTNRVKSLRQAAKHCGALASAAAIAFITMACTSEDRPPPKQAVALAPMVAPPVAVRPFERAADGYYWTLMAGQFEQLERAAAEARAGNTAISDGQLVLAALYGGVAGCQTSACPNRWSAVQWAERRERLTAWGKAVPESVTAEVAMAASYIQEGWAIRGSGYANTVAPDAWEGFRRNIALGLERLEAARPAAKQDPGWHVAVLDVGLAQGWDAERFSAQYMAAVAAHPLYMPIYFTASSYFAPRWRGSPGELRKFIESAVERTSTSMGETLYARLNWSLRSDDMFTNGQADWQRFKSGFERIVADHPDPWNVNNFAKFACIAGDPKTLAGLLTKIGNQPVLAAWSGSAEYFAQCAAYARGNAKGA